MACMEPRLISKIAMRLLDLVMLAYEPLNSTCVVPHYAGTGDSELHSIGLRYTTYRPSYRCDGFCSCLTLRLMVASGLPWALAQALLRPAPEQRASTPCQMQAQLCFMVTKAVG